MRHQSRPGECVFMHRSPQKYVAEALRVDFKHRADGCEEFGDCDLMHAMDNSVQAFAVCDFGIHNVDCVPTADKTAVSVEFALEDFAAEQRVSRFYSDKASEFVMLRHGCERCSAVG